MIPPIEFANGFYETEKDGSEDFRWMRQQATLKLQQSEIPRYLEFQAYSSFYDLTQELSCEAAGECFSYPVIHGWGPVSFALAPGVDKIELNLNEIFPTAFYPGDSRELGVKVKQFSLHTSRKRHEAVLRQIENGVKNTRELLERKIRLESTPHGLGIDLYGVCNIKPPCVYCDWDSSKEQEGANVKAPFNSETLEEYGPFFENSAELINCSIGEPFMMRDFDTLLDEFGSRSKMLEMSSNGQILTERNIQRLLGRNIHLYVSLDAATAETYAKLRNTKFELILDNLRKLIQAKGGPGHYPFVYLVFMPMKANFHELDAFVDLCAELKVDRMILRRLIDMESWDLKWDRGGYHFDYQEELLPFKTLLRAAGRTEERCARKGVVLSNQMDFGERLEDLFTEEFEKGRQETRELFGETTTRLESSIDLVSDDGAREVDTEEIDISEPLPSLGKDKLPACLEPWNRLYILRRGVAPCCYGSYSIAEMKDYKEAWNGPQLRGIRAALAKGKFHKYCLDAGACPVVQKARETGELKEETALAESAAKSVQKKGVLRSVSKIAKSLIGANGG